MVNLPPDFQTVVRVQNAKLGLGSIKDACAYGDEAIYLQNYVESKYPGIFYDCVLMDPDYTNEYYDVDVVVSGTISTKFDRVGSRNKMMDHYNFQITYTDTKETVPYEAVVDHYANPFNKSGDYTGGWDLLVYEVCKGLKMRKAVTQ